MGVQIFQVRHCPFAQRARIALAEKGIAHEVIFFESQHRPPELIALGPAARSPTIFDKTGDDDGSWVWESFVVVEYLEERYPAHPLLPKTALERAQARLAMHAVEAALMAHLGVVVCELVYKSADARDEALVSAALQKFLAALPDWDAKLRDRDFVVGNSFTLADVVLFTPFAALLRLVGDAARIPPKLRALDAWFAMMTARPSVVASADAEA